MFWTLVKKLGFGVVGCRNALTKPRPVGSSGTPVMNWNHVRVQFVTVAVVEGNNPRGSFVLFTKLRLHSNRFFPMKCVTE